MNTHTQEYVRESRIYNTERDRIGSRIEQRKKQIARLEKKLANLECPSWIDGLLVPIAEAMVKKMPGWRYDILGPFGMTAETAIHFYKLGIEKDKLYDKGNIKSIDFRPKNLDRGEIVLVDHLHNTHRYAEGTMGEMNGMNYPTIPMKETIDELLAYMSTQHAA